MEAEEAVLRYRVSGGQLFSRGTGVVSAHAYYVVRLSHGGGALVRF